MEQVSQPRTSVHITMTSTFFYNLISSLSYLHFCLLSTARVEAVGRTVQDVENVMRDHYEGTPLSATKAFNRQVKNNIEKFEQDFMFQLTDEECEILRCKNCTSSWGGRRYNPYAFTEQGIYMLITAQCQMVHSI